MALETRRSPRRDPTAARGNSVDAAPASDSFAVHGMPVNGVNEGSETKVASDREDIK